jgi:hypothetical protein
MTFGLDYAFRRGYRFLQAFIYDEIIEIGRLPDLELRLGDAALDIGRVVLPSRD